jgi:CheY-like chemotaxis protein
MLPKVSGLDVLRALKGDVLVKHIPVVVLSGLGQANDAKLLKKARPLLSSPARNMFAAFSERNGS